MIKWFSKIEEVDTHTDFDIKSVVIYIGSTKLRNRNFRAKSSYSLVFFSLFSINFTLDGFFSSVYFAALTLLFQ